MALEDFAASLQQEGIEFVTPAEQQEQVETPATSPTEKETGREAPSHQGADEDNTGDENSVPFHKHPRWIEREKELKELKRFREEQAPILGQVADYLKQQQDAQANALPQIPEWFSALYGQDKNAWGKYLEQENGIRAQIKNEVVQELQSQAQAEVAEKAKWSDWVNDSLQTLEDEGEKFDKIRVQQTALDYLPTDLEGNIDFRKALAITRELDKAHAIPQTAQSAAQSNARKAIAGMTTSRGGGEKGQPQFETNRSLRNKTFDRLIHDSN